MDKEDAIEPVEVVCRPVSAPRQDSINLGRLSLSDGGGAEECAVRIPRPVNLNPIAPVDEHDVRPAIRDLLEQHAEAISRLRALGTGGSRLTRRRLQCTAIRAASDELSTELLAAAFGAVDA